MASVARAVSELVTMMEAPRLLANVSRLAMTKSRLGRNTQSTNDNIPERFNRLEGVVMAWRRQQVLYNA